MKRIVLLVATAAATGLSFGRPEITWSVMHPTAIDMNYMARVAAKALEYGGVDSFEVCGDCHRGYSGINGLSLLERYPHAGQSPPRHDHGQAAVKSLRFVIYDLRFAIVLDHWYIEPLQCKNGTMLKYNRKSKVASRKRGTFEL